MILKRSFNVGIIIPSLTDPFFPKFAESIETFVEERGSNVIISSSRHDSERERRICESLLAKQVDGLIIMPCSRENIDFLNDLANNGTPVVQLGRYFDEVKTPIVHAANRAAATNAVARLVEYGHKRIIHVSGDLDSSPDIERYKGFVAAVKRYGIQESISIVSGIHDHEYDGCSALTQAFREDPNITALFADNDMIAMGCLKACYNLGLRVPEDMSIISIGGFYSHDMLSQNLATFAVDYTTMSRKAVDFLYSEVGDRVDPHARNPVHDLNADDSTQNGTGRARASRKRQTSVPLRFITGETLGPRRSA